MDILYSTDTLQIKEWATICLEKKLYIQGRLAKDWLQDPKNISRMTILSKEDPIDMKGWAFIYYPSFFSNPFLGVLVDEDLRGEKYGEKLIQKLVMDFKGKVEVSNLYRKYYSSLACLKGKIV